MRYDLGERTVPAVLMARLAKRQVEIEKLQPKVAAAGQEVA